MAQDLWPKRFAVPELAKDLRTQRWVAEGVLHEEPEPVPCADAYAHVGRWLASPVNTAAVVPSGFVAHVHEYQLTDEPQAIAANDNVTPTSYLIVNLTAQATGEYLGEGQALGEGISIAAGEKGSLTLANGEAIYAAAPAADDVIMRVLEFKSA